MLANRFRQFGLRRLFVVVTLVCMLGALVANRFRGKRYHQSMTVAGILNSESAEVARRLKLAMSKLPGHQVTTDAKFSLERSFNGGAFEFLKTSRPAEQVFARITLADGTTNSVVGFWIYERPPWPDGKRRAEVAIVVVGHESYFDMKAGRDGAHEMERRRLLNITYPDVLIRSLKSE